MEKVDFSFKKGWGQTQRKDMKIVREKIEFALDLKNRTSFYQRLNGDVEPRISEVKAIEKIFNEFGITDIWGE